MIPVNEPLLNGNEGKYVQDCIDTAWISSAGKYINRFEEEWAAYCNRKHGVAVSNGTVALELAISVLDLPKNSEVILPSFTIVSCIEAVLRNDLVPVLVDCLPDTYCLDIDQVKTNLTNNTSAIMPVHIYGHPVDMEPLLALAAEKNLKIIEDAAEAHGAECLVNGKWQRCGSFGDVSCFSFYANKNISCGEGGMVLTDNDELAERLRQKRNLCFGNPERFRHDDRGWNFRMTNLQAAVGCAQLEQIGNFIQRKLEMAALYNEGLKDLPLQLPTIKDYGRTSVWMYALFVKEEAGMDATELAEKLKQEGVQTRTFFRGLHTQPAYKDLCKHSDCTVTEKIYSRGLYLPSGQAITDEQINTVINALKRVFA